jgi:tungstate transport system substrate-binding protein
MHNRRPLRIATTIGPVETGLLPALEAAYSRRSALPIEHDALGTGAALERAKRGGVDLVIAHAPELEKQFVADGWAIGRHPFAANDFVLVGPRDDPANVRGAELVAAFQRIARAQAPFLTRGDRSGTHIKEQDLWSLARVQPEREAWYRIAESGMAGSGATAREAASAGAYALLDRATFITAKPGLEIMVEGDPRLLNVFSALPVNPRRAADVSEGGAKDFVGWLLEKDAQALIGDFGRAEHGNPLFLRRDQIPAG